MIAAHMNAYTKWLMDNNMLMSQNTLNQFSQPGAQSTSNSVGGLLIEGHSDAQVQGNQRDALFPLGNQLNNLANSNKNDHDLSTDESSIMDMSETEGKAPAVPQTLQAKPSGKSNKNQVPPEHGQQDGVLFNACEAEKNVAQEDDSQVGPEVSEQMSLMIKNFFGRSRKNAKIDELLQEFIRPKNMPFLKIPFIEDEIYGDLAPGARGFDKNCRHLQGYINAAITALAMSLQQLILTEKLHPIISEAGVRVKKALQLLAFSTKEINDRRKDALKSSVNHEYLPLLKQNLPQMSGC